MSFISPPNGATAVGETVASFKEYAAAQKAVSALLANDIPAREIAIVGAGLRSIERITGKLGYARAALSGTMNGVLLGLLFAAIFVLGNPDAPVQMFFGVLLVGVALGMLMSLVSYSIVRRRRDYASVMQVVADHYEVTVMPANIHRARQLLQSDRKPTRKIINASLDEPPQYGERISPPVADVVVATDAVAVQPVATPDDATVTGGTVVTGSTVVTGGTVVTDETVVVDDVVDTDQTVGTEPQGDTRP